MERGRLSQAARLPLQLSHACLLRTAVQAQSQPLVLSEAFSDAKHPFLACTCRRRSCVPLRMLAVFLIPARGGGASQSVRLAGKWWGGWEGKGGWAVGSQRRIWMSRITLTGIDVRSLDATADFPACGTVT